MRRLKWVRGATGGAVAVLGCALVATALADAPPPAKPSLPTAMLGLPSVPVPADNPVTPAKVALGHKLFLDKRLSSTGKVSCSTCHDPAKAFTDSPRVTSQGVNKLTGTRNAPTVINSAYFTTLFWDGREPSLELQSKDPMVNPVEMGQKTHQPIVDLVRNDPQYVKMFKTAFGIEPAQITMTQVEQAIASFERTVVAGDSPFDRWFYGHDDKAMTAAAKRGYQVFINQGRCVSCHTIGPNGATFTDSRFHNIGVGVNAVEADAPKMVRKFLYDKAHDIDVDKAVLSDPKASALGRFAVTGQIDQVGAFKTSTLRNIAVTAPYFHDGSVKTLRKVVEHYNNGGFLPPHKHANDFLDGGIRPLNLSDAQIDDLVVFLESLTSPPYASLAKKVAWTNSGLPASMKSTVMKQISLVAQPGDTNMSVAINAGATAGGEK